MVTAYPCGPYRTRGGTIGGMTEIDRTTAHEAMTYFGSWLEFRQRYLRVPGIQAAFLLGDEVLWQGSYGLADVEAGTALTDGHLFRIASHSKTFTAVAVLQLVERGPLRLDDPAATWVPYLEGSPLAGVTLRELLAHSGGVIRDGSDGDHWQLFRAFPDVERLQEISLAESASVLPANDRFKYSNIGYSLLGLVIEKASGHTYAEYVQAHILDVLGILDTGPELAESRLGDYAVGYSSLTYAPERVPIEHVDTRAMASATGFYSTASDVVRYFGAHFPGDERLLTDASKRVMQQQQWNAGTPDSGYALGLALTTMGERTLIGHGGGYPGHITSTLADPQDRFAVSVLTNAIDGPAGESAQAAVHLLDLAVKRPRPSDGADLTRFTGRFADLWGVIDVALLGGRLWLLDPSAGNPADQAPELVVLDDHTLRVGEGGRGFGSFGEPVTYTFDAAGEVETVRSASGMTYRPIDSYRLAGPVTQP
ncbi:serine hydrolase domain-containing protein [Acidothermaceae bacterium B102]|nr:serine hydrolase domain-containing protein [Acidothermaceae bacterium B102]